MIEKSLFLSEHGGNDGGAHIADGRDCKALPPSEAPAWSRQRRDWEGDYKQEEEATEEQVAQMTDSGLSGCCPQGWLF